MICGRNATQWHTCRSTLVCLGGLWRQSKCHSYCVRLTILFYSKSYDSSSIHISSIMAASWGIQRKNVMCSRVKCAFTGLRLTTNVDNNSSIIIIVFFWDNQHFPNTFPLEIMPKGLKWFWKRPDFGNQRGRGVGNDQTRAVLTSSYPQMSMNSPQQSWTLKCVGWNNLRIMTAQLVDG